MRGEDPVFVQVQSAEHLDQLAKEAQLIGNRRSCTFIGRFDDAAIAFDVAILSNGYEVVTRAGRCAGRPMFVAKGDLASHSLGNLMQGGRLFAMQA